MKKYTSTIDGVKYVYYWDKRIKRWIIKGFDPVNNQPVNITDNSYLMEFYNKDSMQISFNHKLTFEKLQS